MTKSDYLDEIKSLSKEEQRKVLVDYYNKYSAEKNLSQQITVCELLAEDFDYFGYKILLPNLYYENGEYHKVIDYLDKWYDEIKNSDSDLALVVPNTIIWKVLAYKRLGISNEALSTAEFFYKFSKQVLENIKSNVGENGNFRMNELPVALALSEIGEIYFEKGDYDKAGDYFIEAREYCITYKCGYYLGYFCLHALGGSKKDIKSAIDYLNIVSSQNEEEYFKSDFSIDDRKMVSKACWLLGEIYTTENGYKNKEKAEQAYKKAKLLGYNISDDEISQKVDSITIPEKSNSKGCYVATCVYGSYDCPQVWTLRRFRDNILSNRILGRIFIKCYYAVSPTVVKRFGKYLWFNTIFKMPLDKLVEKLNKNGIEDTPYQD